MLTRKDRRIEIICKSAKRIFKLLKVQFKKIFQQVYNKSVD